MVKRHFWINLIKEAWNRKNVIWLSGVRRVGKTFLCQSIEGLEYFDCELPRVRRMIEEDPESFFETLNGKYIVLDEIHRLSNPSEILKISTDHYPNVKVIATGSSSLGASKKFRDTLTGRKIEIWLPPMISKDLEDFGNKDISHRFLFGGLPPFFLSSNIPERDFQEWVDAYWAKDIMELFRLEKRYSFFKFFELLMINSGGIFEATNFAKDCEVSRTTITNYLSVLESTFIVHVIRPYSTHKPTEIVSAPKVYGFDTGFVCYFKGWRDLRYEDYGYLWEHYVLNEIQGRLQIRKIFYWRDKRGHEVDFVIPVKDSIVAIECKWKSESFNPENLIYLRKNYPNCKNLVISSDVKRSFKRKYDSIEVNFVNLEEAINMISDTSI